VSDPSCRSFRELLGVYVVGAIEPAERAAVDTHLGHCYECREELAGLALLPALLHRVPVEEAEKIAASEEADGQPEPAPEILNSLLRRVGARRKTKRLRAAFTTAAAILIAAGGAAAVSQAVSSSQRVHQVALDVATTSQRGVAVTVHYEKTHWGTTMWVRASGLPQWTHCEFWVVSKDGTRTLAGGWIVGPRGDKLWYPAQSRVPEPNVTGFVLTTGKKVVVPIPAN
jgi:predicted anti-sigma-YlaC factor YlaD